MWSLLIFRRLGLPMLQFFFPASLFWESAPKQTKYVALRREGKKDKLGGAIRNEEEEFIVVIMASELSLFFLVWEISVRFYTKFPPPPLSRMCMGILGAFLCNRYLWPRAFISSFFPPKSAFRCCVFGYTWRMPEEEPKYPRFPYFKVQKQEQDISPPPKKKVRLPVFSSSSIFFLKFITVKGIQKQTFSDKYGFAFQV